MFQLMAKKDTSAETLPAQVELQPSVHLLDALGCIAHFSLDLITAPEVCCSSLPLTGNVLSYS